MTFALRPDVSVTDTDHGMVLLDESTGRYWQLNSSGALILHALLDGATPQQTARRLGEHYPSLTAERTAADVAFFIRSLTEARLVVTA
ncbi:lasso peptide biosynthesis PqqD family chaperone [Streptomyces sp. AV19]|uniref:lasso peptide biosynthesis PqqD family chaperone n=1 Tax=Streptomyces sp. AV19 TaxID=2793068 RepID=UPI0018FE8161|nr:lasso peptide biosynthesis PqqD family chaperone [Streptomyces sp. AV19]MBH1937425.1 lasso peptide biosynthesis PqqD family chaperone [Streptomyces sp. AV19]MDG4533802.1 lasso peptide biosynthesis PqqD family chaperone [Streptomyces sp. AV19]